MSAESKHTPGPWVWWTSNSWRRLRRDDRGIGQSVIEPFVARDGHPDLSVSEADMALISAAPDMYAALREGRRAIGDHFAPTDCYATGPLSGDAYRDLVECPACAFIAKFEAAIAKATGSSPTLPAQQTDEAGS